MRRKDVHCRLFLELCSSNQEPSATEGKQLNVEFTLSISDPCVALQIEQAGWPRRISILRWTYHISCMIVWKEAGGSVMTFI
jgi:hypothetical protein